MSYEEEKIIISSREYNMIITSNQEYAKEQPFRNYAHQAIRGGTTNITKLHP